MWHFELFERLSDYLSMLLKRSLLLGPPRKLLEMSLFQSVAQSMDLEIRDCYHPIRHQILPRNGGLTFILPQNCKWSYFSARNFQCTWWAHCATKISNISYTYSARACQQSLKFSDQTDVRSLWNNSSKFRFFFQKRPTWWRHREVVTSLVELKI